MPRFFLIAGAVFAGALLAQPSGTIEGRVLNALTGAPLRKATVSLSAAPDIRLAAETGADGKFQFLSLPPGAFRLTASRTGFLDRPSPRAVTLGPGEKLTAGEIRLPPLAAIAGRVFDEAGEPLDRVRISAFKQVYRNGHRQWTSANVVAETTESGEYRLPNLRPGRYLLLAVNLRQPIDNRYGAPPNAFYVPAYYPGVAAQRQATPVDVSFGAEVRGIDVRLFKVARPTTVRVRGKVTGAPPDSQISVNLLPVDDGPYGGSTVAAPPAYTFELNPPVGQYNLSGSMYSGNPEAFGSRIITVTADTSDVSLSLNPPPQVTGRITFAEEGAMPVLTGMVVTLEGLAGVLYGSTRSDAAGRFTFATLPPARYSIYIVRSLPDGCYLLDIKLGGRSVLPDDFTLTESTALELVLSNTAARIAGSVLDADGKPYPASAVTLFAADGKSRPQRVRVEDDGAFQFTGLRPGTYQLLAWEEVDDDGWQDPEFQQKYERRATTITVGAGETQTAQLRAIAVDEMK